MMSGIKPFVSVVMPVFNAALYLDEAIESILQQTLLDFELIIINDGSTDDSLAMLENWKSTDSRIRLYDQANKGRSFTRNRGLSLATTEFLVMMDADDISMPNRLQLCYDYLHHHPNVVAVSGQFETMCMYGVPLHKSSVPIEHTLIEKDLLHDKGDAFTQGAAMIRKSVAESVGGYDLQYELGEDVDFFLKMALKGKLSNLTDELLLYRQHPTSITNTADDSVVENRMICLNQAWGDRGLSMDNTFVHWLVDAPPTDNYQYLLRWGWNALAKGEVHIARRYAKKLICSTPLKVEIYRFIYCAIRGR